jgi:hypothetical protein
MYIDFTIIQNEPFLGDGRKILEPKDYPDLLSHARAFKTLNPNARFALLRIWSSPYFWPLMLGGNNRDFTSFIDGSRRCWEWKFVPKDMQCSEWSMHYSTYSMLEKFKKQLGNGDMVVQRRDVILVMGKDEQDLMRRVTGVTFAVQDRPWLREIDLFKSFVNVDLSFLERLDKWWLE